MSASREKKKRQQTTPGSVTDAKSAKAAEQRAADKRTFTLYAIVAVVFVVLAIVLVIVNSGIIQRNKTAVTINGEEFNAGQVSYYYGSVYQSYAAYASMYGFDTTQPLDEQECSMASEEGQTWDDYFKEQAVERMKSVYAYTMAADEEGMSLGEEETTSFQETVDSVKSSAAQNGYGYGEYIAAMYGPNVTTGIFEDCVKAQLLSDKYITAHSDSLSYTEEEIQACYDADKNSYDLVDGGYVTVNGNPETKTDDDGNTVEATDEEKEAALALAEQTAEAILSAYEKDGKDLEELAETYNATATVDEDLEYGYGGTALDWLFDAARVDGDSEVVADEDSGYYYVCVFHSRRRNEALDYNVRHILVTKDNLDLGEGGEATDEVIKAKAQEILDSWDGTEDGFAALAEEHSQDGGSNTKGGLYEDVAYGDMTDEFNDWCYESGRKAGDTGIVSTSYGYHIMYFVGYGEEAYWHYACDSKLRNDDVSEWQTEMTDATEAVVDENGMKSVGV